MQSAAGGESVRIITVVVAQVAVVNTSVPFNFTRVVKLRVLQSAATPPA